MMPSQKPSPWTPKLDAELRALWTDGVPTLEIARRLGMTKNSVVGRAHRLRVEKRASPLKRRPAPPAAPALTMEGCRWIEGADYIQRMGRGEQIHCGAKPCEPGSAWCAEHKARVYQAGTASSANWFRDAFESLTREQQAAFKRLRRSGVHPATALREVIAA